MMRRLLLSVVVLGFLCGRSFGAYWGVIPPDRIHFSGFDAYGNHVELDCVRAFSSFNFVGTWYSYTTAGFPDVNTSSGDGVTIVVSYDGTVEATTGWWGGGYSASEGSTAWGLPWNWASAGSGALAGVYWYDGGAHGAGGTYVYGIVMLSGVHYDWFRLDDAWYFFYYGFILWFMLDFAAWPVGLVAVMVTRFIREVAH